MAGDLLRQSSLPISKKVSSLVFTGTVSDSGRFLYHGKEQQGHLK